MVGEPARSASPIADRGQAAGRLGLSICRIWTSNWLYDLRFEAADAAVQRQGRRRLRSAAPEQGQQARAPGRGCRRRRFRVSTAHRGGARSVSPHGDRSGDQPDPTTSDARGDYAAMGDLFFDAGAGPAAAEIDKYA